MRAPRTRRTGPPPGRRAASPAAPVPDPAFPTRRDAVRARSSAAGGRPVRVWLTIAASGATIASLVGTSLAGAGFAIAAAAITAASILVSARLSSDAIGVDGFALGVAAAAVLTLPVGLSAAWQRVGARAAKSPEHFARIAATDECACAQLECRARTRSNGALTRSSSGTRSVRRARGG